MAGVLRDDGLDGGADVRETLREDLPPFAGGRGFGCGEGWRAVFDLCRDRIAAALDAYGGSLRFESVGEVDGAMRIVWSGILPPLAATAVREAVDLAEARSVCVCGVCGEPGRLHRWAGVLATRCPVHARGVRALTPDREDLHLRQLTIGGRIGVVVASRYDFASDSFVDLDPFGRGEASR
jgi:hypothetical protein